jgi:hypothetical protein
MKLTASDERKIANEVVFRRHNQRVQKGFETIRKIALEDNQAHLAEQTDIELQYYCECSDENCRLRIALKLSEYNELHQKNDLFVIIPGHEVVSVERIVARAPTYVVVQKFEIPPTTATHLEATDVQNV